MHSFRATFLPRNTDLEEFGPKHFLQRLVLPWEVVGKEHHVRVTVPRHHVTL